MTGVVFLKSVDFNSSEVKVILAISKSLEFLKALKGLTKEELDMVILSFEESLAEMEKCE